MTKKRVAVPKATEELIKREFNHRCAICGKEKPQIHHIDEDPSHNDPMNLLPLCPNCHLIDQHNPTAPIDPDKLRLFRKHKDPAILHPKFHPVWLRCRFLIHGLIDSRDEILAAAERLRDFVATFEKGKFYGSQIDELICHPESNYPGISMNTPEHIHHKRNEEDAEMYRSDIRLTRDRVMDLIVEMLRYQDWLPATPMTSK